MTGPKWIGALTLAAVLITHPSYGSGPFADSHALGLVTLRTQSSVMINGAPALSGSTIFAGDVLRTPMQSSALVKLRSGASVAMAENSEVVFENTDAAGGAGRVSLRHGAINVQSPGERPELVAIPGASVLLRGEPGFPALCRIAALGTSSAIINDRGHVEVHGAGAPLIIPVGKTTTLEAGRPQAGGGQKAGSVAVEIPAETVTHNGQTAPLSVNDSVYWQDLVATEKTGRVRIALLDGSTLNIGARAQMHIIKHDAQSQQTQIELTAGKLRSTVKAISKQGGSYEVTTQTAVVGVVGTDFIVEAHGDPDPNKQFTRVWCIEGKVSVRNRRIAQGVILGAGEFTLIRFGLAPTPPAPAPSGQLQAEIDQTEVNGGPTLNAGLHGHGLGTGLDIAAIAAGGVAAGTAGEALHSAGSANTNLGDVGNALNGVTTTLNNASNTVTGATTAANNANAQGTGAEGTISGILQIFISPTYPCGCH